MGEPLSAPPHDSVSLNIDDITQGLSSQPSVFFEIDPKEKEQMI